MRGDGTFTSIHFYFFETRNKKYFRHWVDSDVLIQGHGMVCHHSLEGIALHGWMD